MSLLYSILKPIVRKKVKESNHREETYEDFVRTSHELQEKFQLKLPKKNGYEFRVKDFSVHVEPGLIHAYPFFTFIKEGKRGEDELIALLK
jgi:hypothetical protein